MTAETEAPYGWVLEAYFADVDEWMVLITGNKTELEDKKKFYIENNPDLDDANLNIRAAVKGEAPPV